MHALVKGLKQDPAISTHHVPTTTEDEALEVKVAHVVTTISHLHPSEIRKFVDGYQADPYFEEVIRDLSSEENWDRPKRAEFFLDEEGLIWFLNWAGHSRLCVPRGLRPAIMAEYHDSIHLSAHAGYHRTYNRIASAYYWPRMGPDLKRFVSSCDVCQKSKPKRHSPYGLLQPIPIPGEPFEVVSMDFIPELPESEGYNNILVIVDKLTKYGTFIPCRTDIGEIETARLFFKAIYVPYGMPRQVISDRDSRWSNSFWKTLTTLMGSRRTLTTAHHPQADGQTEVLNQTLEIGLRAFVENDRSDWSRHVASFEHAYNSSVHSSTGFTPAYLLRGYHPREPAEILSGNDRSVPRVVDGNLDAETFHEAMEANLTLAKNALKMAQEHQRRAYNQNRTLREFEEGELVLLNPHSMNLVRHYPGKGQKLLSKYEGPFEVLQKISPIVYRLRIPSSYGIHPVISIAHLEPYIRSPPELGPRPKVPGLREHLQVVPEHEVEKIVAQRIVVRKRKRLIEYLVHFTGTPASKDQWLNERRLVNAPDVIHEWKLTQKSDKTDEAQTPSRKTEGTAEARKGRATPPSNQTTPARRSARNREVSKRVKDNPEWNALGLNPPNAARRGL